MGKPFFSIIIPTYQRPKMLKAAIDTTLLQSFKDFEIIVSDNCSNDETEDVVKSFKDKRIKYFKNKININMERNTKKAFSYAKGKYLFSLGDDDFILFENTLAKIKELLDKEQVGFIRLNLLEKKLVGKGLRKSIINVEEDIKLEKNSLPEKVIEFFHKVGAGHIAGIVIKNVDNPSGNTTSSCDIPWLKAIYNNTQKYGGLFLSKYYMVITWSQGGIMTYYDVFPNNRLMFEKYTKIVFNIISKDKLDDYKLKFYSKYIKMQPVIKLYSGNSNLIKFNRRFLQLEPRLRKNISYWMFLIIALVFPKFVWELVRVIQHRSVDTINNLSNKEKIFKRFDYLDKKYYSI